MVALAVCRAPVSLKVTFLSHVLSSPSGCPFVTSTRLMAGASRCASISSSRGTPASAMCRTCPSFTRERFRVRVGHRAHGLSEQAQSPWETVDVSRRQRREEVGALNQEPLNHALQRPMADAFQFVLNGRPVRVEGTSPNTTLLE